MNNFKNPLVLGLLGGGLTYLYLWYEKKQNIDATRERLNAAVAQKTITYEQMSRYMEIGNNQEISLFYPVVVAFIAWCIGSFMKQPTTNNANCTSSDLVANISDSISLDVVKPANNNLWR